MKTNYDNFIEQQEKFYECLDGSLKQKFFVEFFIDEFISSLKEKRLSLKITQEEIARIMGVKQSYISKIENYIKVPSITTIGKYLFALNMSIATVADVVKVVSNQNDSLPKFNYLVSTEFWSNKEKLNFENPNKKLALPF